MIKTSYRDRTHYTTHDELCTSIGAVEPMLDGRWRATKITPSGTVETFHGTRWYAERALELFDTVTDLGSRHGVLPTVITRTATRTRYEDTDGRELAVIMLNGTRWEIEQKRDRRSLRYVDITRTRATREEAELWVAENV